MKTATAGLTAASGEVVDNRDQYEVSFTAGVCALWWTSSSISPGIPYSHRSKRFIKEVMIQGDTYEYAQSDPTHSFLSKDHFVGPCHRHAWITN